MAEAKAWLQPQDACQDMKSANSGFADIHGSVMKKKTTHCFSTPGLLEFYYSVNFLLSRPEVIWKRVYTSYIVPGSFKHEQNATLENGFSEETFFHLLTEKDAGKFVSGNLPKVTFERSLVVDTSDSQDVVVFQEIWDFQNRIVSYAPKHAEGLADDNSIRSAIPLWTTEISFVEAGSTGAQFQVLFAIFSNSNDGDVQKLFLDKVEGLVKRIFETHTEHDWVVRNSSFGHHPTLLCIDRAEYLKLYKELKSKYYDNLREVWSTWDQTTDFRKFIPEDLHIATYMRCLQDNSNGFLKFGKNFVDIGCGNGLLTYLLEELGWKGYGVDLRRRKLWQHFSAQGARFKEAMVKYNTSLNDVNSDTILIGNHPDELSSLIPLLAIQTGAAGFIIIPCCAFDCFGNKYIRHNTEMSVYESHVSYLIEHCRSLGFEICVDKLRIPSTKRIAILGRIPRRDPPTRDLNDAEKTSQDYYQTLLQKLDNFKTEGPTFRDIELRVNNCTQLPRDKCESIIQRIFFCILYSRCTNCSSCAAAALTKQLPKWHTGCKEVTIRMLTTLLSEEDRDMIKQQGNGLLTLLRNYSEIFSVQKSLVGIRLPEKGHLQQIMAKGKPSKLRSKPCFVSQYHPDGCPLQDNDCAFSHAVERLASDLDRSYQCYRDGTLQNI